jgi:quercetin dioxygenase-like cupin family protein
MRSVLRFILLVEFQWGAGLLAEAAMRSQPCGSCGGGMLLRVIPISSHILKRAACDAWPLLAHAPELCLDHRELELEEQMAASQLLVGASVAVILAVPGHGAELNPAALAYHLPEQIRWTSPSPAGSQDAVFVGDPSKPGLYVSRTKWLKGNHFSRPHFHPNDRFITVLSGTWWMGSGTNFEPDRSVPLPVGTFATHFGKQVHWDGAKDEDATVLIFGEGPATSTQVEPTAGKFSGLDPKAVIYTLPDQFKWRDPTGAAGVNQVVLHGDPTKSGPYVVLNRFKPGNFSKPHFHPNDRFITVLKGTWWVATGNKFDTQNTVPMPAGSFVTHFGKQVHWDGAKDEEAWLLIVGEGPATRTLVDPTN